MVEFVIDLDPPAAQHEPQPQEPLPRQLDGAQGAVPQDEWTTFRLTGDALTALGTEGGS